MCPDPFPNSNSWPGLPPVLPPASDPIGRWLPPNFACDAQRLIARSGQYSLLYQLWIEDLICAVVPLAEDVIQSLRQQLLHDGDEVSEFTLAELGRPKRLELFKQSTFSLHIEEHFSRTKRQRDRIIYSMLRCTDQARIQELSLAIREGEIDFTTASIRYSEGPESAQGGRIGPIAPHAGHPDLNQRLEVANEGDLIGPFSVGGQYVLLRLDKRLSTRLDESTQPQLLEELYQDWLHRQVDSLMNGQSIEPIEYLPIL
jgi:hypothetical protein